MPWKNYDDLLTHDFMIFGVIGFGRFGKLWARCLAPYGVVLVYDKKDIENRQDYLGLRFVGLKEVTNCDILFLLVPISGMESCCDQISPLLKRSTIVVDACSVKVYPAKVMREKLSPNQPIIATHPLFGPDSTAYRDLSGHKIVVCPVNVSVGQKKIFIDLLKKLKLNIIESTPREHDQQMAKSQALVHFIGRGLTALELAEQEISTPDYNSLLKMNTMVQNDTRQLFFDIQAYNSYTRRIRERFFKNLAEVEAKIKDYEQKDN